MPNGSDDKWAQYAEKPATDKWSQYAEASPVQTPSLFEQGRQSYEAKGGNVGMPGSFEGKPENIGEYIPQTVGNIASGVGNLAEGNVARGTHEIISGGMNTLLPAAPFFAAAAPGAFAIGTAGSYLGGKAGRYTGRKLGLSPDQQDLAEDVGSLVGGATPFAKAPPVRKLLTTPAGEPRLGLKLISPKRADAIADFLRPDVKANAKAAAEQADILAERQKRASAYAEMNEDFAKRQAALDKEKAKAQAKADADAAKTQAAAAKADAEARKAVPVSEGPGPYTGPNVSRKGGAKPPPPPVFSPEATSSAQPIGNAPLPGIPQRSPTLFPQVQGITPPVPKPVPPPPPSPFGSAVSSATPIGSAQLPPPGQPTVFPRVMTRAELAAQMAPPPKPAPPSPFGGMTSSATPIGSAELPPVPQGQPAPFPPVEKAVPKATEPLRGLKQRVGSAGDLARWTEQDLWEGYMKNRGTPLGEAIHKELAARGLVKTVEGEVRAGKK